MDRKLQEALALFRYGVIAPVLHREGRGQAAYFRQMGEMLWHVPGHEAPRRFSPATFKSWLRHYRRGGFDGLMPTPRCDAGQPRVIDPELSARIEALLAEHPRLPITELRQRLVASGHITSQRISESTLRRHVQARSLRPAPPPSPPRRPFEKPAANDMWTLDFLHGPAVPVAGLRRPQRTYLAAAIDDHSRFVPVAGFFLHEDSHAVTTALKEGLLRYGLPRQLYCDNGAAFSSRHLALACARLGIALVHSKPYDSPSRGKIERFFRTVRSRFLEGLGQLTDLAELDAALRLWLDHQYHRRLHRGIDARPLDRYLDSLATQPHRHTVTPEDLDRVFFRTLLRKVRRDATVQIAGRLWATPPRFIGQTVEIRFPEERPDELHIVEDDAFVARLEPVDLAANANRAKPVRFAPQRSEDDPS